MHQAMLVMINLVNACLWDDVTGLVRLGLHTLVHLKYSPMFGQETSL